MAVHLVVTEQNNNKKKAKTATPMNDVAKLLRLIKMD
jgi:hypothetical protein